MKYTVHIRRTWEERFPIEVSARSAKAAQKKALRIIEDDGDSQVDWSNMEETECVPIGVDDENGEPVPTEEPSPDKNEFLVFVDTIARMKIASEMDDAEDRDEGEAMSGDDACATVSELIEQARSLMARVQS